MKNHNQKITELNTELKALQIKNLMEKGRLIREFNDKINLLISKTPTGDLRNEITELNILFQEIIDLRTQ